MSTSYDQSKAYAQGGRALLRLLENRDPDVKDAPVPGEVKLTLGQHIYKQTQGPIVQSVRKFNSPSLNAELCDQCRHLLNDTSHLGPRLFEQEQGPFFMHLSLEQLGISAKTCRFCKLVLTSVPSDYLDLARERSLPARYEFTKYMTDDTLYALRFFYTTLSAQSDDAMPMPKALPPVVVNLEPMSAQEDPSARQQDPDNTTTSSRRSMSQAKKWIKQCDRAHSCCSDGPVRAKRALPTRLIDVGHFESDIRLRNGSDIHGFEEYIALSHCWGQGVTLKLQRRTFEEFYKCIARERLPKTFADAVTVARDLGIRYLWIDSLCVIQDSEEDWENEAAMMWQVYTNSYLNLSATASSSSQQGLFRTKSLLTERPCVIHIERGHRHFEEGAYLAYDATEWERSVDVAPLNTRAWVLQERLLAPRVLHFAEGQLFWECHGLDASQGFKASEQFPAGIPLRYYQDSRRQIFRQIPHDDPKSSLRIWDSIVHSYTRRNLTKSNDKLIALSGLAKQMSLSMQLENEEKYIAGLWEENLVYQLLWSTSGATTRSEEYRSPSWSWASIDGPVLADTASSRMSRWGHHQDPRPISSISNVVSMPSGDPFGSVTFASLTIVGPLLRTNLVLPEAKHQSLDRQLSQWQQPKLRLSIFEDPKQVGVFYDDTQWNSLSNDRPSSTLRAGHDFIMPLAGGTHVGSGTLDEHYDGDWIPDVYFLPILAFHELDRIQGRPVDISCIAGLVLAPIEDFPGHFRRIGVCAFDSNPAVELLYHLGAQDPTELEYEEAVEDKLAIDEFVFGDWSALGQDSLPKEFAQYQVTIL